MTSDGSPPISLFAQTTWIRGASRIDIVRLSTPRLGMDADAIWILGLRTAGVAHFVTLALACLTPIPPDWEKNLAALPEVHRRFSIAQNVFVGAVTAVAGLISLLFAPQLIEGTPLARVICACIACWWGGRFVVLPWLGAHRHLHTPFLRVGYACLLAECALYAGAYGFLSLRAA